MQSTPWVENHLHQWRTTGRVVLAASRTRLGIALVACLVFTAIGVWALTDGRWLLAALAIGFFGVVCLPAIAWQFARPPRMVVDRRGLTLEGRRPQVFAWHDVVGFGLTQASRTQLVGMALEPRAHRVWLDGLPAARRAVEAADSALLGVPSVTLPNTFAPPGDLVELLATIHLEVTGTR
ncbi:hypothetical protein [Mariniluteicoccus flavus]